MGGFGCFLQVYQTDPNLARMTPNLDVAVVPSDLVPAIRAAQAANFRRIAEGLTDESGRGSVVHLVPIEPLPAASSISEYEYLIAPVADLVLMKLTSFRLKDKVHIQDMDRAGLITSEVEASLSPLLRERLKEVRATR